jgi:hypothetical protein
MNKLGNNFPYPRHLFPTTFINLEKRCRQYSEANLKVPPREKIFKWGRQLGLSHEDIQYVSRRLPLRYQLGKCTAVCTAVCV